MTVHGATNTQTILQKDQKGMNRIWNSMKMTVGACELLQMKELNCQQLRITVEQPSQKCTLSPGQQALIPLGSRCLQGKMECRQGSLRAPCFWQRTAGRRSLRQRSAPCGSCPKVPSPRADANECGT